MGVRAVFVTALLLLLVLGSASTCQRCPVCDKGSPNYWQRVRYCATGMQWNNDAFRNIAAQCFEQSLERLVGQQHVATKVFEHFLWKLRHNEQLIMHFAGDNGVGKTYLAQLMSQALSMYCKGDQSVCLEGDSMLKIEGTSFGGMSLSEARSSVIGKLKPYVKRYSRGVILVDDLTALDPAFLPVLFPLFGRGSYHELEEGALNKYIVVVTTDFGKNGRARGKSLEEIEAMIAQDFSDAFDKHATSNLYTFAFLPLDVSAAEKVAAGEMKAIQCRYPNNVEDVVFSSIVLKAIVTRLDLRDDLRLENGRSVQKFVRSECESRVIEVLRKRGSDLRFVAEFSWDSVTNRIVLNAVVSNSQDRAGDL